MPRHDVRLSRYRRAPTMASGVKRPVSTVAPSFPSLVAMSPQPNHPGALLRRMIGMMKNTTALANPTNSSSPVP